MVYYGVQVGEWIGGCDEQPDRGGCRQQWRRMEKNEFIILHSTPLRIFTLTVIA